MTGSRAIVLVGGALMFVFVALAPSSVPGGKFKRAWAAGVVLIALSLLTDIAPQVAAPATVLVLLALAAKQRGELGQLLGNPQTQTAASSTSRPTQVH